MIIAVIGGSSPTNPEHVRLAEEVGRELAIRGVGLVCGGLSGIMEAACRGAKSAGGITIGILPGRSSRDANSYVDIPIVTTMGFSRNVIVVHTGDAVIAIGGAVPTANYAVARGAALATAGQVGTVGLDAPGDAFDSPGGPCCHPLPGPGPWQRRFWQHSLHVDPSHHVPS